MRVGEHASCLLPPALSRAEPHFADLGSCPSTAKFNTQGIGVSLRGFPGDSDTKESACNVGDPGSIPGSGRSPGEGNGYPLEYPCLEKSKDRCYSPWGHKESRHD